MLVVEVAVQLTDDSQAVLQWGSLGSTCCRCSITRRLDIGAPLAMTSPWRSAMALMMWLTAPHSISPDAVRIPPGLELCGQNGHASGFSKPFRRGHAAA